jgi:hypothetical protein
LAEFHLRPDHGFECDDPCFKAVDVRFSSKVCVDILVEEFPLPICKTFVAEHVQGSDLAFGISDPYWCLGGLIFAIQNIFLNVCSLKIQVIS